MVLLASVAGDRFVVDAEVLEDGWFVCGVYRGIMVVLGGMCLPVDFLELVVEFGVLF